MTDLSVLGAGWAENNVITTQLFLINAASLQIKVDINNGRPPPSHRKHLRVEEKYYTERKNIYMERNISVFANNALSFLASYIINLNSISELCAARNLHYNYKIISGFHFVTKLQRIVVCKL